jgi:uncharacterized protein
MIIDADCHISSHKFDQSAITTSELIALMDRAGIDRALVWLKPPYNKEIGPENMAVYKAVRTYPQRLIGFGWVNPLLGSHQTADEIKRCFEEFDLAGIKFNGAQDGYVIDDGRLVMPFIEQAAQYNKPIAFHIGADFYENTHPYRLGKIAARFPDTRFLMVHMGGAGIPSLERSAIETAQAFPNIHLIASNIPETAILRAIRALGADRVSFGSDTPFRLMHVQLAMIRALLDGEDDKTRAKVLGENIARVIGTIH